MIEIEEKAGENGTKCFFIILKDEDNENILTPVSMLYTLVDSDENVINNVEQAVVDPAELGATTITVDGTAKASTKIVLSGDDLQITADEHNNRRVQRAGYVLRDLVIEATYDGVCGNGLPKNEYIRFPIENIPYIGKP